VARRKPVEGRRPLIAGNWKMNLNHLEALALTQKIAFSLTEDHLTDVEVVVLPPFTDLRSVQTRPGRVPARRRRLHR
jgi:triosephosphate isomerase